MAIEEMMGKKPMAEAQNANQMSGGYCIEIRVSPDGTIQVGREDAAEENSEAEDTNYQPAKSFGDAVRMAMEIYENNGEVSSGDAQSQFDEGYGPMDNA